MRKTSSYLLFIATTMSVLTVSCASDQMASPAGDRLTDEAFCAKITALNNETSSDSPNPEEMLEMLTVIQDMAKVAPTAELQEALEAYTPLLEKMSKLDQNDPEAFATIIGDFITPPLLKAAEVLGAYTTDVCGIEDGSASSSPPTSMASPAGDRLTDEAFCAKITPIIIGDDISPQAMLDSLEVFQDVEKVAPTAELQEALKVFVPFFEKMSKLDLNDPEAVAEYLDLATPELLNAGEVLENFCGIDN